VFTGDSPHEIRNWRDADPRIAVGFEGAPGHQAAGLPYGAASARGLYGNSPNANSFPGYPAESYRTWGGFDWMTATVGGLWDSLLAEGKPWWNRRHPGRHPRLPPPDPPRRPPAPPTPAGRRQSPHPLRTPEPAKVLRRPLAPKAVVVERELVARDAAAETELVALALFIALGSPRVQVEKTPKRLLHSLKVGR
jgi:hypothetical protein